jgi:hypothetical protein
VEGTTPTPRSYYSVAAPGVSCASLCNAKRKRDLELSERMSIGVGGSAESPSRSAPKMEKPGRTRSEKLARGSKRTKPTTGTRRSVH